MHANIEYPTYSLEIYLTENEKSFLLLNKSLEGELELFLRVFPAFNKGIEKFTHESGKIKITLGKYFSLDKTANLLSLTLDKRKVEDNIWNCNYQRHCHGGVYFNLIQ